MQVLSEEQFGLFGVRVYGTRGARRAAVASMRRARPGLNYFVGYQDVQGYGLFWGFSQVNAMSQNMHGGYGVVTVEDV